MSRTYTVHVSEETEADGGGFWAEVVEMPGCYASGRTLDDLEKDIRDAIDTHIAALTALGKDVPPGGAESTPHRQWLISVA